MQGYKFEQQAHRSRQGDVGSQGATSGGAFVSENPAGALTETMSPSAPLGPPLRRVFVGVAGHGPKLSRGTLAGH